MTIRLVGVALVLTALTTGCASAKTSMKTNGTVAGGVTTSTSSSDVVSGASTVPGGSATITTGGAGGPGKTPAGAAAKATTTTLPPMPVTATMSATCVTRGMPVNVTVKTRPQASLAGAVEYADEDAHGNYAIGSADGTGTWRWPFVVSTEAPIGRAVLGVSAQDRTPTDDGNGASTTGEEGSAQVRFEVKKSC